MTTPRFSGRGSPPRYRLSSQLATGLSAHAPAQRAGAQRLCAMAPKLPIEDVRSPVANGGKADKSLASRLTGYDPDRPLAGPKSRSAAVCYRVILSAAARKGSCRETAQLHRAHRQRVSLAARSRRAAAGEASDHRLSGGPQRHPPGPHGLLLSCSDCTNSAGSTDAPS